jgi:hypothetical protein
MFTVFWSLSTVIFLLALLYRWFVEHFDYFQQQGIPGPRPVPLFGTWWGFWKQVIMTTSNEAHYTYILRPADSMSEIENKVAYTYTSCFYTYIEAIRSGVGEVQEVWSNLRVSRIYGVMCIYLRY